MKHKLTEAELKALDGVPVEVHYKLNNPHKFWFCIKRRPQQTIYGYTQRLMLEDCTMRINHTARRKIFEDRANRSVHAWIRGTFRYVESVELWKTAPLLSPSDSELHYNPTTGDQGFTTSAPSITDRRVVTTAKAILFWQKHIYLLKG